VVAIGAGLVVVALTAGPQATVEVGTAVRFALVGAVALLAVAAAGVLGLLLGALALQRASVVSVTSAMVATETVLGALLGIIVRGDRPAAGLAIPAAGGFLLVLVGALMLARFGAPEPHTGGHEETATLPIG
jgi:hypothetical protein